MAEAERLRDLLKKATDPSIIDQLIDDRVSESLWLDFKQISLRPDNGWNPSRPTALGDNNMKNLAKAVAGFANSHGGVVIWGVLCDQKGKEGDVPREKFAIPGVAGFVAQLEGAVSKVTLPAHEGNVESGFIRDPADPSTGYAWTYVPVGNELPYQNRLEEVYEFRSGSAFVKIPHNVLAGMFGRPPRPELDLMFDNFRLLKTQRGPVLTWNITLINRGPGLARDFYILVDKRGQDFTLDAVSGDWTRSLLAPAGDPKAESFAITGKDDRRIVPRAMCLAFECRLMFYKRGHDVTLRLQHAAHGTPLSQTQIVISQAQMDEMTEEPYPGIVKHCIEMTFPGTGLRSGFRVDEP